MKLLCIILSLALAGPAADTSVPTPPSAPTEADQQRGKELFDNGYKLFQEGSYDEAIQAFRLAYSTSGDATLLYNIALAAERAGEYDLALEYLQAYRVHAPADEWDKLAEKAESFRKRKLNAQLEAQRGGDPSVEPATERPVEPTGKPALLDEPTPRERRIFGPAAAVFTSVAAASFATALGLGLAARGRDKAADGRCRDGDAGRLCSDDAETDLRTSRKFALGTDIMIGIGSAAALALVIVLATNAARRKKDMRRRTALQPAGLGFRF